MTYIVVYLPKDALQCERRFIGPFISYESAEGALERLPVAAECDEKHIQKLETVEEATENRQ